MIRKVKRIDIAKEVLTYLEGGSCGTLLYTWAIDYWLESVPYGVITGRDGCLEEWLLSRSEELQELFARELSLLDSGRMLNKRLGS